MAFSIRSNVQKTSAAFDENFRQVELDPDSVPGLSNEAKNALKDKGDLRLFNQRGRKHFINTIDKMLITHTNVSLVVQFLNQTGGIIARRVTGATVKRQSAVKVSLKRARQLALIPYANQEETADFFA